MKRMPFSPLLKTLLMTLFLGGCASVNQLQQQLPPDTLVRPLELGETPFFPQKLFQCGPAALATVLNHSGVSVHPDELTPQVYLPGRLGSLQVEMLAVVRRNGRIPYPLEGTLGHIAAQLESGYPVLVFQNVGYRFAPVWHYAVVVGMDPIADEVILRSGTTRRMKMDTGDFLESWASGDNWAMVTLSPGELPAQPNVDRYLQAVARLESIGSTAAAHQAYSAAIRQWPDAAQAWLGLANTLYVLKQPARAAHAYNELLARWPTHVVALNNLGLLKAERGCRQEAMALIERALQADTGTFARELEDSLATIRNAVDDGTTCH